MLVSTATTILACALAHIALAGTLPGYRIEATLSPSAPQLRGTVETTIENRGTRALDAVVLVLFANRFARPDAEVTDGNRAFVYPYEEFDAGSMTVRDLRVDGTAATPTALSRPGTPDGCLLRVTLPKPLAPGGRATLRAAFETVVPTRFGTFGTFDGMLTAIGGWYPTVAADDALDGLPARADFDVTLHVDPEHEVVLNGQHVVHPASAVQAAVRGTHYVSLVAAPRLLRDEVAAGKTRIVFLRRPPVRTVRHAFGPSQQEITLATLREVVAARPDGVPERDEVVVVEAPLRLTLWAPGEGMVVLSDRALKVFQPVRPFHEAQVAQGVYAELLHPVLAPREPVQDYAWVDEGLAFEAARDYRARQRQVRSVQEWIELFNIFALVDRFETAPKIPFVGAFFERATTPDPLHEQITTFNNDLPPGHVVLGKLRQQLGDDRFRGVLGRCGRGTTAFRACAGDAAGTDLGAFFAQWLQPYPELNYAVADAQLNEPAGDAYRSTVAVRRSASRQVHEPVDVELRTVGGEPIRLRWDGAGDEGRLTQVTPRRVRQAVIDPDRKLIETTRVDDARPPSRQVVFDSAEVEVTSTEFGVSGLLVGRNRYDYRKDVAAAGFYTNRSVGVDVGPRFHWGTQNDPTLYRNNLFLFYDVQKLDGDFEDDRRKDVHTRGHVSGFGVRYNYNDLVAFDNPSRHVDFRLFADGFDDAVGSDYDYATWGGSLVLSHWVFTHRTILAGEVMNGFSQSFDGSRVPLQGLFSLGGSRSIRGIGAEDELARNIFVVRAELRQSIFPELDLNLMDLLVLRRSQVRLFVDTGRVSNSAGSIYDPNRYAVGAGVGLAAVYDFMGFFPSLAYIEIATRADRDPGDVQFLFGTRQSF